MIHARSDYNRIQDPALNDPSLLSPGSRPIAADEPVFLVRASDANFEETVLAWAEAQDRIDDSADMSETARKHVLLAKNWQHVNGVKTADAPIEALRQAD